MARVWQSSDGQMSQPEGGTPEWSMHLRSHLKRVMDSHGPVTVIDLQPHDVKEHPLPYSDVKTQFYRRLIGDGQPTLPIVVTEREDGDGYTLVDGIHRLGVHQLFNKPMQALLLSHPLQKMAIKDIRMGKRIPVAPGHILGYQRFDYSHTLPSSMTSEGYRLNVYHDVSDPKEERFLTAVLTHPKGKKDSSNFPNYVGSVSAHLQPSGHLDIHTASLDPAHRGGKGMPMYEALLAHANRKLGAHTVVGKDHSTMAHKVHQKLSLKHGMDYQADLSPTPSKPESGEFDGHYGPYSYTIKHEEMVKAIGPFIASMMMAASPGEFQSQEQPKHEIAQTMYKPWTNENLSDEMIPIAHLESSWGKNIAHGKGKNEMDTAFGALGFKPQTALEEYNRSKNIQKQHPGLSDPAAFLNEFRGNPAFYNKVAGQHFSRLKKLHGTAEKAAYAWRWGSTAAANATPETVAAEPYVQKYKALASAKKLGKSQRSKDPLRVVSIAAFRDGLMLFGKRGDKKLWCLPGGKMEPMEDKLEAAKREFKEETGLEGSNWRYIGQGEPKEGLTVFCYKCDTDDGDPDMSEDPDAEFVEFRWEHPEHISPTVLENLYNKHDINLELQGIEHGQMDKSEDLIKMAAKKPKIAPEEKNLVVTHNLSEHGLEHAHKLGGLPAPSIAINHKDHPLEGFGDITLVAPHHLADPSQHPTYDADIYSPRQPRSQFKFSDKKMTKLHEELKPHFKAMGSDWVSSLGDEFKKYGPGLTRAGSYNISEGMKHAYLKEKGVDVPEIKKDSRVDHPWVQEPALEQFFKEHGINQQYDHDSDYAKKLGEATRASIDSFTDKMAKDPNQGPEDAQYMKDLWHRELINEDDGHVLFGRSGRIFKSRENVGRQEPDREKMRDWVNDKVKEMGEDDFHDWAEKKLEHLNEGQYIPKYSEYSGNMRKVPYTIENILKEMKGNPRGGEGASGLGAIRAMGAKKFKDIEQMRQHQGQIVRPEEFAKIKDHMNDRFAQLSEELAPYHGSKMNSMRALSEAISESYKRGKYLGHELKLSGFDNVPSEVQRSVHEFAQDLVRMPTEYFEAKPQRVVGLNEFKGAVIPHDSHPRVAQRLRENGVHDIRFYDKSKPGERAKVINMLAQAQNLHLSEDEFYGETLLKGLGDDELVPAARLKIPLSNVFLLNRWGHPITPDRVDYHLQPGANTPPIKAVLGPNNIGEYVHSQDPQAEENGESVPFAHEHLMDPAHPKYFVSDGHHRVRAAQQRGDTHIDAEVHVPETPYYLKGDKRAQYETEVGAEKIRLGNVTGGLAKNRPGPTFPKLGMPDDRRETDIVTTPNQLRMKNLAIANGAYNDRKEMYDRYPELKAGVKTKLKQDANTATDVGNGASPVSSSTKASYSKGSALRDNNGSPVATQLHENGHMMFQRIQDKYGPAARQNLAENLWHHAKSVLDSRQQGQIEQWLNQRYPAKFRGPLDHEERITTVLNLLNDKTEREALSTHPKYEAARRKISPSGREYQDSESVVNAAKQLHQALLHGGKLADKDWLAPHHEFRDFYPQMMEDHKNGLYKNGLYKNEVRWFIDDEPGTRILALKSKQPNPAILQAALEDEHPDVRAFAAQHPALTFEQLFSVLSHKDPETRKAALKNPGITNEHLDFAQHDPDLTTAVLQHPLMQDSLAKNIGFVEFPKLGQYVHSQPMAVNRLGAVKHKMLAGNKIKVSEEGDPMLSGGQTFHNFNTNPDKRLPPRQQKFSSYVRTTKDPSQFKGRADHEAQHSVFAKVAQRYGVHAHRAAVEHVIGALSDRDKTVLNMMNPQLKSYAPGARDEEMIAYMQNFLQDPVRRNKALDNFAPNGRRLLDPGKKKVHNMIKDMWKRMRNRAHEFGLEHINAYKRSVMKSDTEVLEIGMPLLKETPGLEYNVLADMAGSTLMEPKILKAVEFMSGKKADMAKFRHAFWSTEDQIEAALMSVDIEPTDENREALKNIADLQEMQKSNKQQNQVDESIKQVTPVFPEDKRVAEAIQRGVDSRSVHAPDLEGKHVGGIRTVEDTESREIFLLKPGSGALSPAKGVKEQIASPSEREVCFYAVGKMVGLGERFVETYLLNVDGKYVAAMRMLPHQWTNLEKLKFQSKSLPASVLEKYRVTGELHTWGILDYILGNPDRHGQNLMVGPEEDNYPIVMIDHGSALAGPNFDPAHDEDSFIPYYFRAWNQKAFNKMEPAKKLKLMPKTTDAGREHIEKFILKLNPAELEAVLAKYGVDPSAAMKRLELVKHLLSNGLPLDEGINQLWVL